MINSLELQTEVATPPIVIHGLTTVWPPVTTVPASSARSYRPEKNENWTTMPTQNNGAYASVLLSTKYCVCNLQWWKKPQRAD